jgi:nucleoside-diphosphate kinase
MYPERDANSAPPFIFLLPWRVAGRLRARSCRRPATSAAAIFQFIDSRDNFMAVERTLSIVKPDGVQKNVIGEVYRRFEQAGLKIIGARMMHLTLAQAEGFYAVHRERPFFKDLTRYMSSGPVMVQVLEGENAVAKNRELMGATDPKKADKGTIRADLATSIEENVVHGSDSVDNAKIEIAYFFAAADLCPRTR